MWHFRSQNKEISELRQELDKQRRRIDALDEEWSDYYDRFRRLMAKMAKRDERARESEAPQAEGESAAVKVSQLSPTARKIAEQIAAAKQRNGG